MPSFTLPVFYCPFTPRVNPNAAVAWSGARKWIYSIGLVRDDRALRRLDAAYFGDLIAMTYPIAPTAELEAINIFDTLLFFFDDQIDDSELGYGSDAGHGVIRDMLEIISATNPEPKNPVQRTWVGFWDRVSPSMSPQWKQQFVEHMKGYLESLRWEMANRVQKHTPDLLSYVDGRRNTGGVRMCFDLIEYGNKAELPAVFRNSALCTDLRNVATDSVCFTNDIFSHDKEIARGEVNNCVVVCQHFLKSSLQEAVYFVNDLLRARIEYFLQTKAQVAGFLDAAHCSKEECEAVWNFITGLQSWICGCLEWSRSTRRYQDIEPSVQGRPLSWIENILGLSEGVLAAPVAASASEETTRA